MPWIIGSGLVILIGAGLRPKPLPVEIGTVSRGPLSVSVLEEGKTRIRHRYTISPPVAGFLQRVELRAGARIDAGKTIPGLLRVQAEPASLLNPRLQSEAEARVKAAEATLHQRESEVERAHNAADLADREKQRASPLHVSGAISTKDWDAADMAASMRQRELRSAEFALQVAKFELQQAEAALLQAEGHSTPNGEPLTVVAPGLRICPQRLRRKRADRGRGHADHGGGRSSGSRSGNRAAFHRRSRGKTGSGGLDRTLGRTAALAGHGEGRRTGCGFTKISALGVEEQRVKVRVEFNDPLPAEEQLGDRYRVEARIITWSAAEGVCRFQPGLSFAGAAKLDVLRRWDSGRARLQKVEIDHNNGNRGRSNFWSGRRTAGDLASARCRHGRRGGARAGGVNPRLSPGLCVDQQCRAHLLDQGLAIEPDFKRKRSLIK